MVALLSDKIPAAKAGWETKFAAPLPVQVGTIRIPGVKGGLPYYAWLQWYREREHQHHARGSEKRTEARRVEREPIHPLFGNIEGFSFVVYPEDEDRSP